MKTQNFDKKSIYICSCSYTNTNIMTIGRKVSLLRSNCANCDPVCRLLIEVKSLKSQLVCLEKFTDISSNFGPFGLLDHIPQVGNNWYNLIFFYFLFPAKRLLERHGIQTSSSFVKIWMVCIPNFKANFLFFFGVYMAWFLSRNYWS